MPEYLRLKVVRYTAAEAGIPALEVAVKAFIAEIDATVAALERISTETEPRTLAEAM